MDKVELSYRKTAEGQLHSLKTGRRYRPETAWVWSDSPAIGLAALIAKAPGATIAPRLVGAPAGHVLRLHLVHVHLPAPVIPLGEVGDTIDRRL
jgi:hypothetical protein